MAQLTRSQKAAQRKADATANRKASGLDAPLPSTDTLQTLLDPPAPKRAPKRAAPKPDTDPATGTICVRAVLAGYYNHIFRKKGVVFDVVPIEMSDGKIMSATEQLSVDRKSGDGKRFIRGWMKIVGAGTPVAAERPRLAKQTQALEEGKPSVEGRVVPYSGEAGTAGASEFNQETEDL